MNCSPLFVLAVLAGCTEHYPIHSGPQSSGSFFKVSDRYSRSAVKSYSAYPTPIADHCFALFHLKTGETFPMLCRETSKGIYPIPQTVMSNAAYNTWTVMAEPQSDDSCALMNFRLHLRPDRPALLMEGAPGPGNDAARRLAPHGILSIGNKSAKPSGSTPPLLPAP